MQACHTSNKIVLCLFGESQKNVWRGWRRILGQRKEPENSRMLGSGGGGSRKNLDF